MIYDADSNCFLYNMYDTCFYCVLSYSPPVIIHLYGNIDNFCSDHKGVQELIM